jgi:hypothetical protein
MGPYTAIGFLVALAVVVAIVVFQLMKPTLERTEHGWKGKYLTVTRMVYQPPGEPPLRNLKFTENEFTGQIDRGELLEIIEANGGHVLDGDASGLSMVVFRGMDSKEKQDSVILAVLPQLESWYRSQ